MNKPAENLLPEINNKPARKLLLSKVASRFSHKVDLFVVSVSFEVRCLCIAEALGAENVNRVLVCYNQDQEFLMHNNRMRLKSLFGSKAVDVPLMMDKPLITADHLVTGLSYLEHDDARNVLVDITSFTHEALLILIRVIYDLFNKKKYNFNFIYTAASAYSFNEKNADTWLTRGIKDIRTILGYSGEFVPSKNTHLIILLGYEVERAFKLIDLFEPAQISLGVARKAESIHPSFHAVNQLTHSKMPGSEKKVSTFDFSCINPWQTKEDIAAQVKANPGYNVVIASLNNKISTVGVGIFALGRPEIQLCYTSAAQYNTKGYSLPDDHCYLFKMDFGSIGG
ncbi:hypothetical protein Q5H93_21610 [Hymenobacter sp. ASUV-10]|uniref:Uncharacterized protein n=1 Tax=Hymenobacter aranciens TaxID=3063996 RepID=A0ABT9BGI0_9BACT|nr:hypothetical protein [Hymenobacter sp. ASUV-10]MDO7877357.1 hypothetical protein [Hymenobacter sp. ASUV-10]